MSNSVVSHSMGTTNNHGSIEPEPGVRRQFLSPRQLAERWNCAPSTAQRIARNAGIAKYCLGEGRNGTVRYLLSEVEAYEEERRVEIAP